MADLAVYAGLFLTAFVAATILPMQSEAALAGLILLKAQPVWLLVVVASAGNVAGSFANWLLGRGSFMIPAATVSGSPISGAQLKRSDHLP